MGDWQTGNIYEMRSDAYTDDGNPLVAMRTCQHMADKQNLQNIFIHRLQVDMETGVGDEGWSGQTGIDPQAALSWSDDGGHTWSTATITASMGAAGRYKARAVWSQARLREGQGLQASHIGPGKEGNTGRIRRVKTILNFNSQCLMKRSP